MKTAKTTSGTSVSYKYNADGLRTYKKVGSTVHQYEYSGDKLFYEKRGDIKFYYRYDVNGNLMSITRLKANGDKFTLYAVCNSRGDVEELRKESGSLYARYVYDSWGNVLHIYSGTGTTEITDTANLAIQNPFRYRGYYFDTESGLYYLQSRYYDPVTGRFVSADAIIDTTNVLGFNLFSYCMNNPVIYVDPTGYVANFVNSFSSGMKSVWIKGYNYVCEAEYYDSTYTAFSKKYTNRGDSGLANKSDEEIQKGARDKSLTGKERKKYQEEEKFRGLRNKQKRQSKFSNDYGFEKVVSVMGGAVAIYAAYKVVRLLPSLLPPLWPTLVPNVVCP